MTEKIRRVLTVWIENFYNFHSVVWDLAQKSFDFPKKVRFQNEREEED